MDSPTRRALIHLGQPAVHIGALVSDLPPHPLECRPPAVEPPMFERGDSEAEIARQFTSSEKFSHRVASSLIDMSIQRVFI
jgi:hypothetical protein